MAKIYYIAGPGSKHRVGLTFNGQPITANSTPVLDGWGWADYWQCEHWQAWHQELLKVMSPQQAAITFTAAWNSQSADMNPYNWCKYNSAFRNYMMANGINIDSIISAIVMPVFDATGNLAQGAGNVVSNTANAASAVSGLIKPLAFAAVIGAIWYGYNQLSKNEARS